jgi:hypothetical protein
MALNQSDQKATPPNSELKTAMFKTTSTPQ